MQSVVVVSPHRDDAAFSCSIALAQLRGRFDITVANYFTVSEYAPFRTNQLGTVSELRLFEDQAFAQVAGLRLDDLLLEDAPERLNIDVAEISTLRPLDARDTSPRDAIREHVQRHSPDVLLLPLAIGDHIDHRIAQAGAIDSGITNLAFYEDLPYYARAPHDAAENRSHELGFKLLPFVIASRQGSEWKRRCASLYSSQINQSTISEIANFSEIYGQGERLWVTEHVAELFESLRTT